MPRVKCTFCDTRVVISPQYHADETHFARCHKCRTALPPDEYRCQGKVKRGANGPRSRRRIERIEGERCRNWITRIGCKTCSTHKKQVIDDETAVDN